MDTDEDMGRADQATLATEPSFSGRLKLDDFKYTSSEAARSATHRRSPRLSTPLSTASPSRSPSKLLTPARIIKRKPSTGPGSTKSTPSPRKRTRPPSTYAAPATYAHLPLLPDNIAPNLLILFIGLNPGVQTARSGHAYAHPSNLFWKLLHSSGITPVACRADEDRSMPARFSLGLTNIVARPSRNGAELSKAEMDAGVDVLEAKCRRWRPEVVCVVGKSIWESVWRVRKGRAIAKAEFTYGWQDEAENMGVVEEPGDGEEPYAGAKVFVATSTSGLAASLRPEEKERIWKELGDWCVKRRKEREEAAEVDGPTA